MYSTGDMEFATRLVELRKARDMSQDDLANRVGVKAGQISHFETGRRAPSLLVLKRIANALATSMDYLTGRTDDPELRSRQDLGDTVVGRINRTVEALNPEQQDMVERMVRGLAQDVQNKE
jgi:transcriptional regulator with XRE-family HTH domain